MKFSRTEIPDVIVAEPTVFGDHRGYFAETFRQDKWEEFLGFKINFCQDNESNSSFGVLRGLHYQIPPFSQTKLVRVIEGTVLDIAVDLRKDSPTFGQHIAIELTGENKKQLFIPRGFAHGFVVLSESATFAYKVDNYYHPESDKGIAFDDTFLNIDWKLPFEKMQLSQKDTQNPKFLDAVYFQSQIDLYV